MEEYNNPKTESIRKNTDSRMEEDNNPNSKPFTKNTDPGKMLKPTKKRSKNKPKDKSTSNENTTQDKSKNENKCRTKASDRKTQVVDLCNDESPQSNDSSSDSSDTYLFSSIGEGSENERIVNPVMTSIKKNVSKIIPMIENKNKNKNDKNISDTNGNGNGNGNRNRNGNGNNNSDTTANSNRSGKNNRNSNGNNNDGYRNRNGNGNANRNVNNNGDRTANSNRSGKNNRNANRNGNSNGSVNDNHDETANTRNSNGNRNKNGNSNLNGNSNRNRNKNANSNRKHENENDNRNESTNTNRKHENENVNDNSNGNHHRKNRKHKTNKGDKSTKINTDNLQNKDSRKKQSINLNKPIKKQQQKMIDLFGPTIQNIENLKLQSPQYKPQPSKESQMMISNLATTAEITAQQQHKKNGLISRSNRSDQTYLTITNEAANKAMNHIGYMYNQIESEVDTMQRFFRNRYDGFKPDLMIRAITNESPQIHNLVQNIRSTFTKNEFKKYIESKQGLYEMKFILDSTIKNSVLSAAAYDNPANELNKLKITEEIQTQNLIKMQAFLKRQQHQQLLDLLSNKKKEIDDDDEYEDDDVLLSENDCVYDAETLNSIQYIIGEVLHNYNTNENVDDIDNTKTMENVNDLQGKLPRIDSFHGQRVFLLFKYTLLIHSSSSMYFNEIYLPIFISIMKNYNIISGEFIKDLLQTLQIKDKNFSLEFIRNFYNNDSNNKTLLSNLLVKYLTDVRFV